VSLAAAPYINGGASSIKSTATPRGLDAASFERQLLKEQVVKFSSVHVGGFDGFRF
jgi:hypothetical protein